MMRLYSCRWGFCGAGHTFNVCRYMSRTGSVSVEYMRVLRDNGVTISRLLYVMQLSVEPSLTIATCSMIIMYLLPLLYRKKHLHKQTTVQILPAHSQKATQSIGDIFSCCLVLLPLLDKAGDLKSLTTCSSCSDSDSDSES